jgi:hypothetical protein
MGELLDAMARFFEEDDWHNYQIEGETVLALSFKGENGQWNCFAQAREEHSQVIFYSVCPVTVPETRRHAMAEYLTRANYGLVIGNFELDFVDGEVRYKTSLDLRNADLTPGLMDPVAYANVYTMDRYMPGILAVTYGDVEPADAIQKIEGAREA